MRFVWVFLIGTVFVFFPPRANAIPQPEDCYGITQTQVSAIFGMPMVQFFATPSPQYFISGIWRTNCDFMLTGGALSILMMPLDPKMTPEVFKAFVTRTESGSNQVFSEMVDGVGLVGGFRWGENNTDLKLLVMTQGKGMLILSAGGFRKLDVKPILISVAKQLIPHLRDEPLPKNDE